MSRIGKKPIAIPAGVQARVDGEWIVVKGPKGELKTRMHPRVAVRIADGQITFTRVTDGHRDRAFHGLQRSLVAGTVEGVTKGFEKTLEITGVGYRAQVEGRKLTMALGLSHPVVFEAPAGITIEAGQKNQVIIRGIDKHLVGHVASKIRDLRPPEPYKGKGIRYTDEHIRRKVGKTGA